MHSRRRYLAAALVVATPAGCSDLDPTGVGDDGSGTDDADGTDDPGTAGTDGTSDAPTETAPEHEELAQQPDPDLPITVENRHVEPHTLSLTVARSDGTVVHESIHELDPGDGYEAYNLREADPDGVERFDVAAEAGERRREMSVRTNACYGDARVGFDSKGELFATYSIC